MNIFGFTLSAAGLLLLTAAGSLIMLLLGVYVTAAVKRRHDASAAYRSAFDDVLLNLRENPDCSIAQIACSFHAQHLAAIDKFRSSVRVWQRSRFEKDVAHYKDAYDIGRDHGNAFAVAFSENTPDAQARREHYSVAIKRLLSYA